MNVQEYRELKKKKLRKYRNIKVEACPECWMELKKDKNSERRNCYDCRMSFYHGQFVLFDSKAEWEHGLMLKRREQKGEIERLKHQYVLSEKDGIDFRKDRFIINFSYFVKTTVCGHLPAYVQMFDEIKGLNKKADLPYIQGGLKNFYNRCKKIKNFTGIEVSIYAGGREFRFNEKGKLKEVL